ncbi:DUF433 domain-containing protein [Runella slithyformis]|uniref:DUF433 domain-containing protein n=1 Tax=Runella slithyformis (strain ATCC 29530 / DSM 19594 / LMG 11500 / NCIMB 11436 / LSU 4) TaxID=761193 RepID=A0A7U3ZLZ9_RUNSL|nr:DUF433 domain-containing protein [Runella slithyformis]AEI49637.1 protein of unknown function DUF433 [Runella slithyformis DSM 19594]
MDIQHIISINSEILSGTSVFTGTRVPIETLFWHLEDGISLDDFLQDFPSVKREQAVGLLEMAQKTVVSPKFLQWIHEMGA